MAADPLLVCLHGSPRPGGNTDLLLEALGEGAAAAGARVQRFHCRTLDVRPCTGCGSCSSTGDCVHVDEMERVYRAVDEAGALVVGAPVYFLGAPARLKAVIDRCQCRWVRRYVLGSTPENERPGAFLSAAGSPAHSVFTCAQRTVEALFDALGFTCRANLLYENVDEKGAICSHPTALDEARSLGETLTRIARGRGK